MVEFFTSSQYIFTNMWKSVNCEEIWTCDGSKLLYIVLLSESNGETISDYYLLLLAYMKRRKSRPTLYDGTTSSIGWNVWLACFCESLHTKHTGSLSFRQKSLSFSLCDLQMSSGELSLLSLRNDSHKFFKARLYGGSCFEDLLLQMGHSWVFLVFQNCWRHALQTLWLQDRSTGALKIS